VNIHTGIPILRFLKSSRNIFTQVENPYIIKLPDNVKAVLKRF